MLLTDLLLLRFVELGAEWVLWVLVALSIVSIGVMIERIIYYRRHRVDIDDLAERLQIALRAGDSAKALQAVEGSSSIECVVIAAGLREAGRGPQVVSEAMASAKARERLHLEAYLSVLGTLGNNAPFIGLLGTVLGIIKASHDLSVAQASEQAGAGAVMAGVFEALVATAVGLFVAIPAVIAFNIFQRRVRAILGRVDTLAHLVLSLVASPATAGSDTPSPTKATTHDGR